MSTTTEHVENAYGRAEVDMAAILNGIEHFQSDGTVEQLRDSDPELLEELESLGFDPEGHDLDDDLREMMYEYALSIDSEQIITIWLTMGGPNIYLEARVRDRMVTEVRHFAVWGSDRREVRVPEDSALWRYAEDQAELWLEVNG